MELSYKLEVFEGPLDLLLHLIEKNELDIMDIPVTPLLDQFMEYVRVYEQANMENLSEFLLMASRLLYIKSRSLLPPDDSDDDNPLEELTAMLADYARYKELAGDLGWRFDRYGKRRFVREPQRVTAVRYTLKLYPVDKLTEAYRAVFRNNLRRLPPAASAFEGIIVHRAVSVATKAIGLLRRLIKVGGLSFRRLLSEQGENSDRIACFLAILELTNRGRVRLAERGDADFDIDLVREG